eukprot:400209-Amphidinium_carterae.1
MAVPLARLLEWAHRVQKQTHFVIVAPCDFDREQGPQTEVCAPESNADESSSPQCGDCVPGSPFADESSSRKFAREPWKYDLQYSPCQFDLASQPSLADSCELAVRRRPQRKRRRRSVWFSWTNLVSLVIAVQVVANLLNRPVSHLIAFSVMDFMEVSTASSCFAPSASSMFAASSWSPMSTWWSTALTRSSCSPTPDSTSCSSSGLESTSPTPCGTAGITASCTTLASLPSAGTCFVSTASMDWSISMSPLKSTSASSSGILASSSLAPSASWMFAASSWSSRTTSASLSLMSSRRSTASTRSSQSSCSLSVSLPTTSTCTPIGSSDSTPSRSSGSGSKACEIAAGQRAQKWKSN